MITYTVFRELVEFTGLKLHIIFVHHLFLFIYL